MTLSMGSIPAHYMKEKGADALAVQTGDQSLTWGQLEERASRRAWALKSSGVQQNDMVTLALANSNEFFEWTFAIWKLGATPHLVSPRLPKREMQGLLELARPKALIASQAELFPDLGARPVHWGLAEGKDGKLPDAIARYWRAISSGGSTGKPKIVVDHGESTVDFSTTYLRLAAGDIVLNIGPLYHSAPFGISHNALFKGLPLIGMVKFDPEEALALIDKWRVTSVNFVPTMMQRIWRLPSEVRAKYDLSSLTNVWHMAAAMPMWLKEAWIEWIGPENLYEAYSSSERIGATVINGVEWLKHKGSVGRPKDCSVMIVDMDGNPLPAGQIGEILFKHASRATRFHYVGADSKEWSDGYQSLGDFGWLDDEGYLYLSDRRTDLIISGGANIYPAEIESALLQHSGINEAVVIGLPHEDLGSSVHAIIRVEPSYEGRLNEEDIRQFLADKLVRYKVPRSFEFVSHELRNEAGKVNRSNLRNARIYAREAGSKNT